MNDKDQNAGNGKDEATNFPLVPTVTAVPAKVEGLSPSTGMQPVKPEWMKPEEDSAVQESVKTFMELIRSNPTDMHLSMRVMQLGDDGSKELMPNTNLYEKKIAGIMRLGGEQSPVNKSLLQLKQAVDQINPAVVEKQPISYKVAYVFSKTRLPGTQEVLDMIYARRETVQSTIVGLKEGFWQMKDQLLENMEDLVNIYEGLEKGQRLTERDIYFGQLLFEEIQNFLAGVTDGIARQNIEQLQADLTSQVINLQTEENANMQFFAGAQALAKLTRQQVQNITGLSRLLERTVLANLGLRVVAVEMGQSLAITEGMKEIIGETIADTARQIKSQGEQLNQARSNAMINLKELEQGCDELEAFFASQAEANRLIIEEGQKTSLHLTEMTARLRQRVEGGHETIGVLTAKEGEG